jgi:hypothetical protein
MSKTTEKELHFMRQRMNWAGPEPPTFTVVWSVEADGKQTASGRVPPGQWTGAPGAWGACIDVALGETRPADITTKIDRVPADPAEEATRPTRGSRAEAAYHEAGHAVVGWATGREIVAVSMRHVEYGAEAWPEGPVGAEFVLRAVVTTLAGGIAGRMLTGSFNTGLAAPDSRLAATVFADESERPAYIAHCEEETATILGRCWPAVTALAAALLERGELSGDAARAIMQAAMQEKAHGDDADPATAQRCGDAPTRSACRREPDPAVPRERGIAAM